MDKVSVQEGIVSRYKEQFLRGKMSALKDDKGSRCILFCKKVGPNLFDIKKGIAVMAGPDHRFQDGVCIIEPSTKVVFLVE
ncbi:MAG: hypothetical protein HQL24_03895 [Candidatus Omnitrophica bacterium]|nr:hypothetical protein [Candidatus Omnitrophota bacterium]